MEDAFIPYQDRVFCDTAVEAAESIKTDAVEMHTGRYERVIKCCARVREAINYIQ